MMTDRAVLVLFFMQLVIERHGADQLGFASGLSRGGHEQRVIGLTGVKPWRIRDLLESGADSGVMTAGALYRAGGLLRLTDLHMTGQTFFMGLILVLGKGEIALFGLVLGVAFGAVLLLPRGRKNHLRRRVAVMQGFIERDQRPGRIRRPRVTGPALLAAGSAFLAGLGRVVMARDAVVVINGLDFRGIRIFLTLELGRDRVAGHSMAGFALPLHSLGVLVMLEPDHRIIEITEFLERIDGYEIRAQCFRFDRFLFSPKSVQTESSHSHAYAQDSNPSQHWSSLLHVKIPLLKSAPENSGNLPRAEAPPPLHLP